MSELIRILLVEDNQADVGLIREMLPETGLSCFRIESVPRLSEALNRLKNGDIDLALVDLGLPDSQGISTFRTLHKAAPGIPLIVLTGNADHELAVTAVKEGAQDYLVKGEVVGNVVMRAARYAIERKRTEEVLRESEEKYKFLIDKMHEMALILDKTGTILFANRSSLETFGYSEDEVIGKSIAGFLTKGSLIKAFWAIAQEFLGKHHGEFEVEGKNKNGEIRTLLIAGSSNPIHKDGKMVGILVSASDITERKLAEEALRESEQRLRRFYESGMIGAIYWNMNGQITDANDKFLEMTGYSRNDLVQGKIDWSAMTPTEFKHCDEVSVAELKTAGVNKVPFEKEYIRKDGTRIPILIAGAMLGEASSNGVAFVLDITERKLAEEMLRQSEARYRILFDQAADIILQMEVTPEGMPVIRDANNATLRLLGYERDELIGQPVSFINVASEGSQVIHERRENILSRTGTVFETKHRCKDGTVRDFECSATEMQVGSKTFSVSFEREITKRKMAEKKLQVSEEKYRSIFENVQDLYYEVAMDGTVLELSPSLEVMSKGQYHRDDLIGTSIFDFFYDAGERQALQKAIQDGKCFTDIELTLKNRDGSLIPCSISSKILFNAQGNPEKIIGIMRDITNRVQAEAALRESEEKFKRLFEESPSGIAMVDMEGQLLEANRSLLKLLGLGREDLVGKNFTVMAGRFGLDNRKQIADFRERLTGGTPMNELTFSNLDGKQTTITVQSSTIMSKGHATGVLYIINDMTWRMKAENELRNKTALLMAQLNSSIDGILIVDPNGKKILQNRRTVELWKIPQVIADDVDDARQVQHVMHLTKYPDKFVEKIKYLYSHPDETTQDEVELTDGTVLSRYSAPVMGTDGRNYGRIWTFHDFTEVKRAERELRESKALVDAVVENVPHMIFLKEASDLRFVIFNRAGEELLGYDRTALLGKNNLDLFPPEQAANFMAKDREVLDGESGMLDIPEEPILTAKNGQRLLHTRKICIRGEDGTTKYLLGISEDITERKQAEEKLRESEERYRTLFDDAKDGIALADAETGKIVECNQALCAMVGMDKTELVGQMQSVLHPPQAVVDGQSSAFIRHKTDEPGVTVEDKVISKSGALTPVEIRAARVRMNNHDYMLGIFRDVSERKQHENEKEKLLSQLLQAQKMEAIGTLAGGVAHDFNNLLTAISGFTTMAMMKIDEADPVQRDLKQVSTAATRAAGLTRQLLLFSRKQHMEPMPMDPNATISRLLKMLERIIGENIVIETSLEKELGSILGDEGNIEQVLMNLSVNARDAMPQGGKLFIKTENVAIGEEYCTSNKSAHPGRFVCISVSDTGTGMDELTQEHIFEPFFTTKLEGQGTGLGLSVVFGIVQQHEGWITVYSEPGHGTTFKVYLPSTSEMPEQQGQKDAPLAFLEGKGERIMVVEDQPEVRAIAKEMLMSNGYSVLTASNAQEATELFEKENGKFDLVFSDVVLPDRSGVLLVQDLLKRGIFKVIITSGYTDEKANWDFIKDKKYRFLHKPYEIRSLLLAVREVLEEKQKG